MTRRHDWNSVRESLSSRLYSPHIKALLSRRSCQLDGKRHENDHQRACQFLSNACPTDALPSASRGSLEDEMPLRFMVIR